MRWISVASLLICIVSVAVCRGNMETYLKHVNTLREYPCGEPQPRVFELEEVVEKKLFNELARGFRKRIRPGVTILHRCESSGCCTNSYERCMMAEQEDVTLTFVVTADSIKYHDVLVKNHTRCACGSIEQAIK